MVGGYARHALAALLLATSVLGDCNADNCLRALRATQTPGRLEAARSFCATFTSASVPATAIPSYAAVACKSDQGRISSACNCIAAPTSSSASAPASTSSVTASPTVAGGACASVSILSASWKAVSPAGMCCKLISFPEFNADGII